MCHAAEGALATGLAMEHSITRGHGWQEGLRQQSSQQLSNRGSYIQARTHACSPSTAVHSSRRPCFHRDSAALKRVLSRHLHVKSDLGSLVAHVANKETEARRTISAFLAQNCSSLHGPRDRGAPAREAKFSGFLVLSCVVWDNPSASLSPRQQTFYDCKAEDDYPSDHCPLSLVLSLILCPTGATRGPGHCSLKRFQALTSIPGTRMTRSLFLKQKPLVTFPILSCGPPTLLGFLLPL